MASAIGEGWDMVWPVSSERETITRKGDTPSEKGTAIWLDKVPGERPLWFHPTPKGMRHEKYTEMEKCAIVDYALEVRGAKSIKACAKEIGIDPTSLSNWIRWECKDYQIFSDLSLDTYTLRAIDYRKLLINLRSGIESVTISDYTGGSKYFTRRGNAPALETILDGHPYFVSPERGERRVFTESQKARVVDYWLHGFDGESFSECARECNLCKNTLIEWVDEHRSKRTCSDATELSENSPEATASDPDKDPFLGMSWQEAAMLYPETPVEP
ncbi:MAG: hypothetical protein OXF02_05645 [Simkaniaceae bacterium]|nr:hypothetical protein [Simkaniaceae bacterium]